MSEFSGLLKSRIEVLARSADRSPSGVALEEWHVVVRCLAHIALEGSGDLLEGMALSALPRFRVVVRNRPEFAIDQRLRWQGRTLAVRQLIDDPAKPDRLVLRCEEVRQ